MSGLKKKGPARRNRKKIVAAMPGGGADMGDFIPHALKTSKQARKFARHSSN